VIEFQRASTLHIRFLFCLGTLHLVCLRNLVLMVPPLLRQKLYGNKRPIAYHGSGLNHKSNQQQFKIQMFHEVPKK
jgi:hypothetical protein